MILPREVPTIINAVGNVIKDFKSVMLDPIIPLKKTVIGAAVKEKICDIESIIKLRLNTKS